MIRSFCVGAALGFFLGSTKQGASIRETIDGFLTAMIASDESAQHASDETFDNSDKTVRKGAFGSARNSQRASAGVGEHQAESNEESTSKRATKGGGVSLDRAKELAEALNAKPTTPPTDELEPGTHAAQA